MEVEFWWLWWDGGLWWAVLVCRLIFMSNRTRLSWKGHLPCAVRQDVYYLSYFCPFGRQRVEKAPSWLHLWLAISTNAQNSKIREVVTAPYLFQRLERTNPIILLPTRIVLTRILRTFIYFFQIVTHIGQEWSIILKLFVSKIRKGQIR